MHFYGAIQRRAERTKAQETIIFNPQHFRPLYAIGKQFMTGSKELATPSWNGTGTFK